MSKYKLEDSNGIRLDYCNMQKTAIEVKECQSEYKAWESDHETIIVLSIFFLIAVFIIGFICGKVS